MLSVTEDAANAINAMLLGADLPAEGGLRITAEQEDHQEPTLALALTESAEPGDVSVDIHGAHVFLDPPSAEALDDKILDAEVHEDHAHFAIIEQGGA
jgi:Fe-S cluster assembly iron-binding protein IscA